MAVNDFNSLPHAEVDEDVRCWAVPFMKFQLTTSRRGRRIEIPEDKQADVFQLTTSRRGRRENAVVGSVGGYFNSLPHAEVDKKMEVQSRISTTFQLTTSRRGRR